MKKFIIDHIDPLGQGVFKENDQIYFIPKTLPDESGTFQVIKSRKGVNFGEYITIETKSNHRITPDCPHFEKCSGCHFLHTSYDQEIGFKLKSYTKLLGSNYDGDIETICSSKRLHYRNRVQLHYNLARRQLGFKLNKSNNILNIAHCKIMNPAVEKAFDLLQKNWIQLAAQTGKKAGHVEIYDNGSEVNISWNQPYAQGGFTQVNQETNELLQKQVLRLLANPELKVLDLFGGKGNLSQQLPQTEKLCVDLYPDEARNSHFFHLDLFKEDSLKLFQQEISHKFDTFLVDPPRSGFKQLSAWVNAYAPSSIVYVSCHPSTMMRDIAKLLPSYKITKASLVDLFPGTFHYEALIFLEKCSQ